VFWFVVWLDGIVTVIQASRNNQDSRALDLEPDPGSLVRLVQCRAQLRQNCMENLTFGNTLKDENPSGIWRLVNGTLKK
jgi:hypothetical protein